MASLPVRQDHHSRMLLANHARNFQPVLRGVLDSAVGDVQGMTPRHTKNLSRFRSLAGTIFRRAAGSHLALSQVENPSAMATLGHLEHGAAAGLLDIVTVGGDSEDVQ